MEFSWFRKGSVAGACEHTIDPLLLCLSVGWLVDQFGWLSILLSVSEFRTKIIAHLTEFCSILYTACVYLSASCHVTAVYKVSVYTTLFYFFKIHC